MNSKKQELEAAIKQKRHLIKAREEVLAGLSNDREEILQDIRVQQGAINRLKAEIYSLQFDLTEAVRAEVKELEKIMQCTCDLDSWEPERETGHTWVCQIHRTAKGQLE